MGEVLGLTTGIAKKKNQYETINWPSWENEANLVLAGKFDPKYHGGNRRKNMAGTI
jgi:hypothetical protein